MHAYRAVEIRPDLSRTLHVGQHNGGSGERLSRLLEALHCENEGIKLGSDRDDLDGSSEGSNPKRSLCKGERRS